MMDTNNGGSRGLAKTLTPLGAWALAFGCSVGWGAFVMPGTTFLPIAGPIGTLIGILIGALVMLVIALDYHYLMNLHPDAGGTYTYAKTSFGFDHGYLCAWFLLLTYIAIIWANATAIPLIGRNLLSGAFQIGPNYEVAGYRVYFGEVFLAIAALVLAALACLRGRLAVRIQIVMAAILLGGVLLCAVTALVSPETVPDAFSPAFPPEKIPAAGVLTIVALAPWAFVGFESICHCAGEFSFSPKKSFRILALAVVTAAICYALLVLLAVSVLPEGCDSWPAYILNLGSFQGVQGLPTFFAAESLMGRAGRIVLALTTLGGIVTGLVGNYIASSRLLYALSEDEMLPKWFGRLDRHGVPANAIVFLLGISVVLPFLGRTAVSWIVDVTTVGATIAYAYASAASLHFAREEKNSFMTMIGGAGLCVSLMFVLCFLVPNLMAVSALAKESYLILASWGILGLLFFLWLFRRDTTHRLGRSTVTWIVLLALIIFTSSVWMRQEAESATDSAVTLIGSALAEEGSQELSASEAGTVQRVMGNVKNSLIRTNVAETVLVVVALAILFYIYSLMQKRERQMEVDKVLAEESSRAKTSFLSNMSHEIRTPMNAIIGLDNIALKDPNLTPHTREQLEKIGSSARHLLGLINDILDMSRIESGRMVLKQEEFSFRDFLDQINVMINGQCVDKGLNFECKIIGTVNDYYIGDDMKLKQVLINILGNAVKFTPVPGSITFTVEQTAEFEGYCTMRFVIKDTGVGMSKEYLPKIFEAFSQEEGSSTAGNKYGSTGLGMAITKNIVEMMNGEIGVESEKGVGTTFTVAVTLKASGRSAHSEQEGTVPQGLRVLIVDDDPVACEHAQLVANAIGTAPETCTSPVEALKRLSHRRDQGAPYQLVLTDYRMPEMDGIAFTRSLRAFDGGETPVIILTGYSWDDIQDEANASGVDGIMSKPLFTDSLIRQIGKVLDQRQQTREESVGADASGEEKKAEEGHLEGRHVLIAEDFEINAEILIDLLEMEGISADHAENGQLAVELFSSHPEHYYDAVLMDVRMPVMDGLAATRAIRELDREDAKTIPIIALTANAFDEDVQRSLQAGMSAHLSKPVEPERLYDTLEKLIRK